MNIESFYFDTNFYREFVFNKTPIQIQLEVKKILTLQAKNCIDSYIHIYVLYELFAHLSDSEDPSFFNCRNAIIAICHHCKDLNTNKFKIVNDFDSEMLKHFYNLKNPQSDETYDKATEICNYIFMNDDDQYLENIRNDLNAFSKTVSEIENNFILGFQRFISAVDPFSTDWHIYKNDKKMRRKNLDLLKSDDALQIFAREEIRRLNNLVGIKTSEEQNIENARIIVEYFRMPLVIKIEIVKKLIESGFNLTKKNRGNWFWDLNLASCVFTSNLNGNIPFGFVTNDGGILSIAEKNCLNDRIISVDDFFKLIY